MAETNQVVQAEHQTSVSKTKKYNDLSWSINIYLTDLATNKTVELETDNISSITFVNNLIMFVPKIFIEYTDNNNILTPYVKKNGSTLTVNMSVKELRDNVLTKVFYIDKFTVLDDPNEPKRTVTKYNIIRS